MHHLLKLSLIPLLLLGISSICFASIKPVSLASDSRMQQVPYQANNVVSLTGIPFVLTQIIFAKDQRIMSVSNGDSSAWEMQVNKTLPNLLLLKPTIYNSQTDLQIWTENPNGHRYHYVFALTTPKSKRDAQHARVTYAIQFVYPDASNQSLYRQLAKNQKALQHKKTSTQNNFNHDYRFSGDASLYPKAVYDNGRFTTIVLHPNQVVPAVFAVTDKHGDEAVVNVRMHGNTLVIQRVAPQFTLREGKHHVASVFNEKLIAHMQPFHRGHHHG